MSKSKKGNLDMGTENPRGERPTLLMRLALRQERRRAACQRRLPRLVVAAAVLVGGSIAAGVAAYAYFTATGSGTGQAQAATVTNLTISAVASPSPTHVLYPGSNGDVVLKISNPNGFPVTVTQVSVPSSTSYATGYTDSGLTVAKSGCDSSSSLVAWNFASGSNPHNLTGSLTVGANGTLTVTMTNDATMGLNAPAACEGVYFSMAPLVGVTAASSTSTATSSPATDSWTS